MQKKNSEKNAAKTFPCDLHFSYIISKQILRAFQFSNSMTTDVADDDIEIRAPDALHILTQFMACFAAANRN